ncbi:MAG: hypothetical protein ACP5OG_04760 [Candidatus Nanoarchaeia archaeon]
MGIIDRIAQMRQQGLSEPQIINSLKQEGFSPREIEESLSQSEIKYAIDDGEEKKEEDSSFGMQPSMMQSFGEEEARASDKPESYPPSMQYSEQYSQPQSQQDYYQGYQQPSGVDIDTVNELAGQIIEEKLMEIRKEMLSVFKIKEELDSELKTINSRIEKMENNFNQLQIAILGKIGEYGKNIQEISKEMHMTQDSFSKILNPLADNIRELQKITGKEVSRPKPQVEENK